MNLGYRVAGAPRTSLPSTSSILPSTSPRSCNNSNSNSNNSSNNNNSNNSNDDDHKRPPSPAYNPRNKLIQAADVEAFVGRHVPGCHIDNIDVYRCALTHPSY